MKNKVLEFDPSRPYQVEGTLLAIWLPRGRGKEDKAQGLVASLTCCANPTCLCVEKRTHAWAALEAVREAARQTDSGGSAGLLVRDTRPPSECGRGIRSAKSVWRAGVVGGDFFFEKPQRRHLVLSTQPAAGCHTRTSAGAVEYERHRPETTVLSPEW